MNLKSIALSGAAAFALMGASLAPVQASPAPDAHNQPAQAQTMAPGNRARTQGQASPAGPAASGQSMAPSNGSPGTVSAKPLESVTNAKKTLASATVETKDGKKLGKIERVNVGPDGHPQSINVRVGGIAGIGSKTVAIQANEANYDAGKNMVVAELTRNEITNLPEATSGSAGDASGTTGATGTGGQSGHSAY